MPLQRPSIFGSVITCELCYSAAHVSVPSRFVSPIPHIHRRPNCASGKGCQRVCNQERHSSSQLQSRFNLESLHMTHDAVKSQPSGEGKETLEGCHPNLTVDSRQQKEQERERERKGEEGTKVDFITLCFLRGVPACCRVASQPLICPLSPLLRRSCGPYGLLPTTNII